MEYIRHHILVCTGEHCAHAGADAVFKTFEKQLSKEGLSSSVKLISTGQCEHALLGPVVVVYPEGVIYVKVKAADVSVILEKHIKQGQIVRHLQHVEGAQGADVLSLDQTGYFKKQKRIALRNCGVINPEDIKEYIATDGYRALYRALKESTPREVLDQIKASGLRGRGGGGFPTGLKWEFAHNQPQGQKYVCCNADEGDPGAFMDRAILEGDPHSLIEAMAIAAYCIGSDKGYIYVRAEYPTAVSRLNIGIAQAKELNLLGDNIFGSDFGFDLEIRLGAGAFVCGEETALMTSIEGHRGEPRPRPPFPAVKGLFGKPTILNNVETYANIPWILNNGAESFTAVGTAKSPGTKVFALGGKIRNTGLIEVPMGITLREIVEDIGGGCPGGKAFKAAQTGGPSGGCIPAALIDTRIDYDSLISIGSMMGSGGMIIMDEDNCMVDIAQYFLDFTVDESCGKCTPCRIGTKRLHQLVQKFTSGNAAQSDLTLMRELCQHIKGSSLCGLGQSAPNPVLSTMTRFMDEYEAHVAGHCPAHVCKSLMRYLVKGNCTGCTACARVCPVSCISGEVKKKHEIDQGRCIKCGACMEKCRFNAIEKA